MHTLIIFVLNEEEEPHEQTAMFRESWQFYRVSSYRAGAVRAGRPNRQGQPSPSLFDTGWQRQL
jgi:hypothetical protein